MRLLVENIKSSVRVVIDTSTFFSAIYNRNGNEAKLFELADEGMCSIFIVDYVLDEMKEILKRKNMGFGLVMELLDTYNNIHIKKLAQLKLTEIELAKNLIEDIEDRPVFIFAVRMIELQEDTYFISGDNIFFQDKVKKFLKNKVLRTREAIRIIENVSTDDVLRTNFPD